MLKGLDPLLSPLLLYRLASMGHGDELAVVDRNFPAVATARRLVWAPGEGLLAVVEAILSVFPLDQFAETPVAAMVPNGEPDNLATSVQAVLRVSQVASGRTFEIEKLDPQEFYDRTRAAFVVVTTGEEQLYGCVMFRKGVILPSEGLGV